MKKLLFTLLLAAAGTLPGWAEDVTISTAAELQAFAERVNGGENTLNATITADIDAGNLTPIGTQAHPYKGVFDGGYHVIKLAIDKPEYDRVALIGCAGGGNSDSKTTIKNLIVTGSVKGKAFTAGIVGASEGGGYVLIENCGNEAAITGSAQNAAGIIGCNYNSSARIEIFYCYNAGAIVGSNESAGISGWLGSNFQVKSTYNIGSVSGVDGSNYFARNGSGDYASYEDCMGKTGCVNGGWTSFPDEQIKDGTMMNKDGDNARLNKTGDYWGQNGTKPLPVEFFGKNISVTTASQLKLISERVNTISISNQDFQLEADIDMSSVTDYWPIGTLDNKYKGELNGKKHTVKFSIDNGYENQGFFGVATNDANIHDVIVDGSVKAKAKAAGIIGFATGGGTITLSKVINKANVESTGNTDANAAGLVGCAVSNTIIKATNCANMGTIKNSGYTGGTQQCAAFCGWSQDSGGDNPTKSTFTNCWNSGIIYNVEGTAQLYRNSDKVTAINCYDASTSANRGQGTLVDASTISSGELCYLLNGNQSEIAFTQDLSQEGYPTFGSKTVTADKWFNTADNDVYYNFENGSYTVYQLNLDETKNVYTVPGHVTAKNVNIARNIPAGQWIGLCLPFDYDIPDGWDVRKLDHVNGSGESASMVFASASSIEAGKPYIVKPTEAVTNITATNKAIATESTNVSFGGVTMVGNLCQTSITTGSFYINTSSELKKLTATSATLKGFRAYFTVESNSPVKALSFDFDDDPTGISLTPALSEGEGEIYNLAGQRINKMQKGINIINGKKILK